MQSKIKFSEAVLLGTTLLRFDPTTFLFDDCGCLKGQAYRAVTNQAWNEQKLFELWPWLETTEVEYPEWGQYYKVYFPQAAYLFINGVAYDLKNGYCTLEQVLDWLRSIEPQDETESNEKEKSLAETQVR